MLAFICELCFVGKLQKKPTAAVDFITINSVLSKKEEHNQVCELWKRAI